MSKNNKLPTKILAIDPGTRYLGIAVLEKHTSLNIQPELLDMRVKTITNRSSSQAILKQCRKIITDLIDFHQPEIIVQEKLFFTQCKRSENLKKLVGTVRRLVKKGKLVYCEYTPTTVRQQICQNDLATKKETAQIIASFYPELAVKLTSDRESKVKHWYKMFDAVALGLCYWQNLNNRLQ